MHHKKEPYFLKAKERVANKNEGFPISLCLPQRKEKEVGVLGAVLSKPCTRYRCLAVAFSFPFAGW